MTDGTHANQLRRVGILGGGQLARMTALAGLPLGFEFVFLDPSGDACAAALGELVQAEFADAAAARSLAHRVDVLTFDFENVPADTARAAAAAGCPFQPGVLALEVCQDRLVEKDLLRALGIPVPDFCTVDGRTDLPAAIDRLGFPCVLKTRRMGYDGKGQVILDGPADVERAWQKIGGRPLIVEAFVPFEAECSLLAVRDCNGQQGFWPLIHNQHDDGMLVLSQPGSFPAELQAEAEDIATRLQRHFDYVGVMAVEFFLEQGKLSVNEIAPRVHNSGHWTIDGAATSQFENHLRAICGLPLGDTGMDRPSTMFNWIGELPDRDRLLRLAGLHWHEYGKRPRPGRKLGHATVTAPDAASLVDRCWQLVEMLGGPWPDRLSRFQASRPWPGP